MGCGCSVQEVPEQNNDQQRSRHYRSGNGVAPSETTPNSSLAGQTFQSDKPVVGEQLTEHSCDTQQSDSKAYLKTDPAFPGITMYGEPRYEMVTSQGKEINDKGVIIKVPEGAISDGENVTISLRHCVSGNYEMPEGYQCASSMCIINPNSNSSEFKHNIEVSLEHFARAETEEDCSNMAFVTAEPKAAKSGSYVFQLMKGIEVICRPGGQSIMAKVTRLPSGPMGTAMKCTTGDAITVKYSAVLYKTIDPPRPRTNFAVFSVYPLHPLFIAMFNHAIGEKFSKLEVTTSHVTPVYFTQDYVNVTTSGGEDVCTIKADRPTKIHKEEVDVLLETNDAGIAYTLPMVTLTFRLKREVVVDLMINVLGFHREVSFPVSIDSITSSVSPPTAATSDADYQDYCFPNVLVDGDILRIDDLRVLMNLLHGVVTKWREIGLELGIPNAELDIIQSKPVPEQGAVGNFREMLGQWLKWTPPNHPYPRIGDLCRALRCPYIREDSVAAEVDEVLKVIQIASQLQKQAMEYKNNEMTQTIFQIADMMIQAKFSMAMRSREQAMTTQMVHKLIDKSQIIVEKAKGVADNCTKEYTREVLKKHIESVSNFSKQLSQIEKLSTGTSRSSLTGMENIKENVMNLLMAIGEVFKSTVTARLQTGSRMVYTESGVPIKAQN